VIGICVANHELCHTPLNELKVVDCDWNMDAPTIAKNAVPLVQYIRANGHPNTPIVMAEGTDWPVKCFGWLLTSANYLPKAWRRVGWGGGGGRGLHIKG
jgi:hypothetical protein